MESAFTVWRAWRTLVARSLPLFRSEWNPARAPPRRSFGILQVESKRPAVRRALVSCPRVAVATSYCVRNASTMATPVALFFPRTNVVYAPG